MRVLLLFLLAGCNFGASQKSTDLKHIEDVKGLLGKPIKELRASNVSVNGEIMIMKDTVLEDEGINWSGVVLFNNKKAVVLLECNWKDKEHISRITLLDSTLRTSYGFTIGTEFREIKKVIDFKSWVNFPDGYIMFKDSLKPWMIYSMDINTSAEQLLNQPLDQKTIPEILKVESIIVQ